MRQTAAAVPFTTAGGPAVLHVTCHTSELPLADGGLKADGEPLAYIPAAIRNSLHQQYPPPEKTLLTLEPVHVGQCSICTHEHRGVIEGALRNGSSYRELEASFGVSKAAISRHVAHARSGQAVEPTQGVAAAVSARRSSEKEPSGSMSSSSSED